MRKAKHPEKFERFGNLNGELNLKVKLCRFDNFARFYTARTNFHTSVSAAGHLNPNSLQVRIKTPPRFVVSV